MAKPTLDKSAGVVVPTGKITSGEPFEGGFEDNRRILKNGILVTLLTNVTTDITAGKMAISDWSKTVINRIGYFFMADENSMPVSLVKLLLSDSIEQTTEHIDMHEPVKDLMIVGEDDD